MLKPGNDVRSLSFRQGGELLRLLAVDLRCLLLKFRPPLGDELLL